jgi:GTP pyrophosphokinase
MIRLADILEKMKTYHPEADLDLLKRAYIFSAQVHKGQSRLSGEAYLTHPMEVAYILCELKLDEASVATGMLHDTVEDTHTSLEKVSEVFGEEVASLVDGVTKISRITFDSHVEKQAENFRKMILAMAKDIRVILVKLADRVHNMRTLEFLSEEHQMRIARETLDIYAPLANRLGIYRMKEELETLAFFHLQPAAYHDLERKIRARRKERGGYVHEVVGIIREKLASFRVDAEVTGRPKSPYSVYEKMERQHIDFDRVHDLIAFRIMVTTIRDCYEVLGIIHSVWKPVPGRFKDYIAMPKANMYQSLHTTVIGPHGQRIEIQIRSEEMHRIAEEGIAAHWKYKEGRDIDQKDDRRFAWLRQLLEWQQDLKDPREFLESVRVDLFPEEVYVFTPKGEVKEFPAGATPVDFAYSIHTDVGNRCFGAKVNGRLVPLKYTLVSGETVEILTSARHKPSKDWLRFVKTSRARTKIQQWIKGEERQRSIALGRELCEKEFRKHGMNVAKLLGSDKVGEALRAMNLKDVDEFFRLVGYGKLSSRQLLRHFVSREAEREESRAKKPVRKIRRRSTPSGIQVKGVGDVLVRFGKCCDPIPGDKIKGYITRGRGVTVHGAECVHIQGVNGERLVEVDWDTRERVIYPAKIRVLCLDKKGMLADISSSIALAEGNISSAQVHVTEDKRAINTFEVEVNSLHHLEAIIRSVAKVSGVLKVDRVTA